MHIHDFLGLEVFFGEVVGEGCDELLALHGGSLMLQLAALEGDEAVGEGVGGVRVLCDMRARNLHEVGQGHHRAADDEVEAGGLKEGGWGSGFFLQLLGIGDVAHFLGAGVLGGDIGEAEGGDDLVADAYLLADAIDQVELRLGEHDGQGYAREAAAGAEVHDAGAGAEVDDFGDAQRVEDMVLIEVVDVLARDDIDFGVPVVVEGVEGCEALALLGGEGGEVLLYN